MIAALAASTGSARNESRRQEPYGVIDIDDEIKNQIGDIWERLGSDADMSAQRQAVLLLWLAELNDSIGDYDRAGACFEKILVLFPSDIAVHNRYGELLLNKKKDLAAAEKIILDAIELGSITGSKAEDRGDTQLLLAGLYLARNKPGDAIDVLKTALFLFDEHPARMERTLDIMLGAYYDLKDYGNAFETLLALIGKRGSRTSNDIYELKQLWNLAGRRNGTKAEELADAEIEKEKERKRRRLIAKGGRLVNFNSTDGFQLEGTLFSGKGEGAVLLIPEPGNTREIYDISAQLMLSEEISSLSFDLRGCGGSRGDLAFSTGDNPGTLYRGDIEAAIELLSRKRSLNPSGIIVVAEGKSCGYAENALAEMKIAPPALYFSPIFNTLDKELLNNLFFRKDTPLMIIYSKEDLHTLSSLELLKNIKHLNNLKLLDLERSGHGADIMKRSPEALSEFLAYIEKILGIPQQN